MPSNQTKPNRKVYLFLFIQKVRWTKLVYSYGYKLYITKASLSI